MNTKNLNEYSFNEDLKLAFIDTDIQTLINLLKSRLIFNIFYCF